MRINIIRPALVYGPNMKGNLNSMLRGIEQGWFPPLPRIKNKRSMIHVEDLISAILLLNARDELDKEIFVATDGKFYSSSEIYDVFRKLLGKRRAKIRVPIFFFKLLSFLNSNLEYRISKLLEDEVYDSSKLFSIGFLPKKSLEDLSL